MSTNGFAERKVVYCALISIIFGLDIIILECKVKDYTFILIKFFREALKKSVTFVLLGSDPPYFPESV